MIQCNQIHSAVAACNTSSLRRSVDNGLKNYFGTINQYSNLEAGNPGHSACTNCAQCFVSRALSWDGDMNIRTQEIDEVIHEGKANHARLYNETRAICENNPGLPLHQSFSHPETQHIYELSNVVCKQGQSTQSFFKKGLETLKNFVRRDRLPYGGILHAHGKTYALVIYPKSEGNVEYILFDSHGNQDLNGTEVAYVSVTENQNQMVEILSRLIPYISNALPNISPDERKKMETADNEVIFYIVNHGENIRYPRINGDISLRNYEICPLSVSERDQVDGFVDKDKNSSLLLNHEAKKMHVIAIAFFAAVVILLIVALWVWGQFSFSPSFSYLMQKQSSYTILKNSPIPLK